MTGFRHLSADSKEFRGFLKPGNEWERGMKIRYAGLLLIGSFKSDEPGGFKATGRVPQ